MSVARFGMPSGVRRGAAVLAAAMLVAVAALAGNVALAGSAQAVQPAGSGLRLITEVKVGPAPGGIAVDPATDTIYVAIYKDSAVSVISGVTSKVTATIHIPGQPIAVAVDPATNTLYVSNKYHSIFVISGVTDHITATIDTGGYVPSIAADPDTGTIYAGELGKVLVISGATHKVVRRIGGVPALELAVDPATNVIYAANLTSSSGGRRSGVMAVISGATDRITTTVPLDGPLVSLAVNPATDTIYVVHLKGTTQRGFSVINGKTNTETANITLGPYPWGIAADPASNAIYVTIANQSGTNPVNLVSEFAGATDELVAKARAGNSPEAIAVNPRTDTIYAGNFDGNMVAVLSG